MLIFGVILVRAKLLQNTQDLGMSLAESYAAEEELQVTTFRNFLELGSQYVEELNSSGADTEEIQTWLHSYFAKITAIVGENVMDPYAVIDGAIVAANPWEGNDGYDYQGTDWYRQALEADGEVIFTDAYIDVITGSPVITAARKFEGSDDVLAMDIFPRNFHERAESKSLPEDGSLYLCDSKGTLLYSSTKWDASDEELQYFTDELFKGIQDGSLLAYDASFRDPDGVQRGAYYYEMSNGWTVILTIPFQTVLMGERNLPVMTMVGISALVIVAMLVMVIRDLVNSRRIRQADTTIHILSDSFYAIYRVNYKTGVYEAIKTSPDVADALSKTGDYQRLLSTVGTLVDPETFQEFSLAFSLESIRQRVAAKIPDYGGDYQRRFGDVYKWVNIRTLYDGSRAPDEVILCFREVDLEKRLQLQHMNILQEALETAKKSTKAKNVFFSNMSHDMRTPLNAIIGLSELAQRDRDDREKVDGYMRKIAFSGKQMLSLVNDILELSRLESGRHTLDCRPFNLRQCVEDLTAVFQDMARKDDRDFSVKMELTDAVVEGDPYKLGQILNNLLSNAFKYSESGDRVELTVKQFDFQQHSKYQFTVEDTGIGMSEQFLEHIFDPYARETRFASQSITGTGLGMPIVKSLVQQMSGEIAVESALGEGSRFTVTLPMEVVRGAEPEEARPEAGAEAPVDLTGKRVLLAEDNELNREIAVEILAMNGMEVVQAGNGAEAVEAFQKSPLYSIHAILMDMQMPVMDGCTAARAIRALDRPDAAGVPIIAATANAFAEDIAKTTEAGMNGHISKPIDFAVLNRTLARLIKG
ncbi:hybrid sensor histidine kinase/response regulator [Intestinimonas timonensis]|uniref:hybrid sensor histidine kinase/response regulator n=1 Tax=Intestinimonas timonensis TaxID=1689270 RepID=UPI0024B20343|nr:hybrid sensor histidine kinase/response regulator [Intestinimonas timonensis]